jgi:hypothetical protein
MAVRYLLWPFGIFYGRLVFVMAIWYILWLFGIFFPFWYVVPRKIWQPWSKDCREKAEADDTKAPA